jgi:hypothetical protein
MTAATTTLRIRLIDKPPLLLLRLATRCRAPLALAILFSKCVLNNSFGSSQKPSHFVASYLIANDCSAILTTTPVAARAPLHSVFSDALEMLGALFEFVALDHQAYVIHK